MGTNYQFVDPEVSRAKFDAEIADYLELRLEYEKRGWFLVEYRFPEIFVILATPKVDPPAIVYGLRFDYSNYDARPPSVVFVKPFGREPCTYKEIPPQLRLNRAVQTAPVMFPGMAPQMQVNVQPLLQAFDEDEMPFLCIAGVLEYHEHPAHRGDVWELHRNAGAGRLVRLLEVISRFGVEPIPGYRVNLLPQVSLEAGPPPP
jgi:hypothetical protein